MLYPALAVSIDDVIDYEPMMTAVRDGAGISVDARDRRCKSCGRGVGGEGEPIKNQVIGVRSATVGPGTDSFVSVGDRAGVHSRAAIDHIPGRGSGGTTMA